MIHPMLLVEFIVPGDVAVLESSLASCSRKLDHSSARDSLRLELSGKNSDAMTGVLGVR